MNTKDRTVTELLKRSFPELQVLIVIRFAQQFLLLRGGSPGQAELGDGHQLVAPDLVGEGDEAAEGLEPAAAPSPAVAAAVVAGQDCHGTQHDEGQEDQRRHKPRSVVVEDHDVRAVLAVRPPRGTVPARGRGLCGATHAVVWSRAAAGVPPLWVGLGAGRVT